MATIERPERDAEIVRRAVAGESERALARAFGISRSQVWDIKRAAKKAAATKEEEQK
jgi:DNA invertase Pin-like site-specific DNA recombinase